MTMDKKTKKIIQELGEMGIDIVDKSADYIEGFKDGINWLFNRME